MHLFAPDKLDRPESSLISGDEHLKAALRRLARIADSTSGAHSASDRNVSETAVRRKLLEALTECFTLEELKTLCFELGIDGEAIYAEANKIAFARELIAYCERQRLVKRLIDAARRNRPGIELP